VPFFCLLAHRLSVRDALAVLCGKLDAGASLSKRDQLFKSTPLGWACRWGRTDLVQLYLSRGADTPEPGAETRATPLAWATKGGHHEISELLRAHETRHYITHFITESDSEKLNTPAEEATPQENQSGQYARC
jgi:ankyrin repeat protein